MKYDDICLSNFISAMPEAKCDRQPHQSCPVSGPHAELCLSALGIEAKDDRRNNLESMKSVQCTPGTAKVL